MDGNEEKEKCYTVTVVFDSKEAADWFDNFLSEMAGFGDKKAIEEFKGNWTSAVEVDSETFIEGDVK